MNYYWSADLHLGHANIIAYCNRKIFMNPYEILVMESGDEQAIRRLRISEATLKRMNVGLIRNWNERVKPDDIVIHVGDFCFKNSAGGKRGEGVAITALEWEKKLNGRIIHVKGNHDRNNSCKTIIEGVLIKFGGRQIYCVHKPDHCNYDYDINFTGHVHEKWKFRQYVDGKKKTDCINVGTDQWRYRPVQFKEIMRAYSRWVKTGRPHD